MKKSIAIAVAATLAFVPSRAPARARPDAWLGIGRQPLLRAMLLIAERKPSGALPLLEASAAKGNALAAIWLARLFADGIGGAKKPAPNRAICWATLAAAEGNPGGLLEIGKLYKDGRGVAKSPYRADIYFAWAAARGCLSALDSLKDNIGMHPIKGPKRRRLLLILLRGAGTPAGKCDLALLYSMGLLVGRDEKRSIALLKSAAASGNADAMAYLGSAYFSGSAPGVAVKWLRRAARAGSVRGMVLLSFLYATGKGVPKSRRRSWLWTRRAAEHGDALSMSQLGLRYSTKALADGRWGRAARWYLRAIANGDTRAEKRLRDCVLKPRASIVRDRITLPDEHRGGVTDSVMGTATGYGWMQSGGSFSAPALRVMIFAVSEF